MRSVVIRDARPEEGQAVLDVWRVAFEEEDTHGELSDVQRVILDDYNARLLVAESDGRLVATLIATFDGWRGNMYRMAVLPELQRTGIARELVAAAETWLRAVGCRRVTALVETDQSQAAAFWRAVGYELQANMGRFWHNLS